MLYVIQAVWFSIETAFSIFLSIRFFLRAEKQQVAEPRFNCDVIHSLQTYNNNILKMSRDDIVFGIRIRFTH